MEIADLTGVYLETVAQGGSLEEYEKSFPELFEHYFRFWADRRQFRVVLDEAAVIEHRQALLDKLPIIEGQLASKGFDLNGISIVLFTGQDTSNGHVVSHDGQWYVWLPIETYATDVQRDVFVTHEIIHALHYRARPEFYFRTKQEKNDVGRELMTEGLATYLTMKVGEHSLERSLWADFMSSEKLESWMNECQTREHELSHLALGAWRNNEATELFYANDPHDITKYRAGYYLGARIVERIVREKNLKDEDILNIPREELIAVFPDFLKGDKLL